MRSIYKIFFILSTALTVVAIAAVVFSWQKTGGELLGTDFRGGSVLEIAFAENAPTVLEVQEIVGKIPGISGVSVRSLEDKSLLIKSGKITNETRQGILDALTEKYGEVVPRRFDDIGPTVGAELKSKSLKAAVILLIVIIIYLAIVFRSMARVLSPWVMGVAAVAALLHDVIIPVGVLSLLAAYKGIEISAVFVAAVLTILGYSVSDTVVVFDRVRENVIRFGSKEKFAWVVHKSILQTLTRSVNTSLTTLLALVAVFLFGGESVKYFALALIIGITSGTYSSIFIASPIIVWLSRKRL